MGHFHEFQKPYFVCHCFARARIKVLNADEGIKSRLRLGDRTAADFAVTSAEPAPHKIGDGQSPGLAANRAVWASGAPGNPDGPRGPQEVLNALVAVGVGEEERDGLLRGLAAILHIGQVRWRE